MSEVSQRGDCNRNNQGKVGEEQNCSLENFPDTFPQKYTNDEIDPFQLMHLSKMMILGYLVPGIAHEINNPTNYIHLNSEILTEVWKDTLPILEQYYEVNGDFLLGGVSFLKFKDRIKKYIKDISTGSNRIQEEILLMQRFAKSEPKKDFTYVNFFEVVNSVIKLMSYPMKKFTKRFFVDCENNLPPILGNFQQLELMLINLLVNSIQALNSIEDSISLSIGLNKEKCIQILLKDEGIGISGENLEKIWIPFFTTKALTGSIGLGLTVCRDIITQHKGSICISSTGNKGTTVRVKLPIVSGDLKKQKV